MSHIPAEREAKTEFRLNGRPEMEESVVSMSTPLEHAQQREAEAEKAWKEARARLNAVEGRWKGEGDFFASTLYATLQRAVESAGQIYKEALEMYKQENAFAKPPPEVNWPDTPLLKDFGDLTVVDGHLPLPRTVFVALDSELSEEEKSLIRPFAERIFKLQRTLGLASAKTEDSFYTMYDETVILPLKTFFGSDLDYQRNKTHADDLTTANSRLDVVISLHEHYLFAVCEEKSPECNISSAYQDFSKKLTKSSQILGRRSWLLGYATTGLIIEFVVLYQTADHVWMSHRTLPCHLYTEEGCLKAMGHVARMGRIINFLDRNRSYLVPESVPFVMHARPLCIFQLVHDGIKKWPFDAEGVFPKQALNLYRALEDRPHDNVMKVRIDNPNPFVFLYRPVLCQLKYSPFGVAVHPGRPIECYGDLVKALIAVRDALHHIHSLGFVHRDVRWPNIFWIESENSFRLGDLEFAAAIEAAPPPLGQLDSGRQVGPAEEFQSMRDELLASVSEKVLPADHALRSADWRKALDELTAEVI